MHNRGIKYRMWGETDVEVIEKYFKYYAEILLLRRKDGRKNEEKEFVCNLYDTDVKFIFGDICFCRNSKHWTR